MSRCSAGGMRGSSSRPSPVNLRAASQFMVVRVYPPRPSWSPPPTCIIALSGKLTSVPAIRFDKVCVHTVASKEGRLTRVLRPCVTDDEELELREHSAKYILHYFHT